MAKKSGSGRLQRDFEAYWEECAAGIHDEVCPYYFAGRYGCSVRHARRLIMERVRQQGGGILI